VGGRVTLTSSDRMVICEVHLGLYLELGLKELALGEGGRERGREGMNKG